MVTQYASENARATGATQDETGDRARYADYPLWREMAAKRGLRMPAKSLCLSTRLMRRWFRRLHIDAATHEEWCGLPTLGAFIERNADLPLYAWVGLMLELVEWGGPEA